MEYKVKKKYFLYIAEIIEIKRLKFFLILSYPQIIRPFNKLELVVQDLIKKTTILTLTEKTNVAEGRFTSL